VRARRFEFLLTIVGSMVLLQSSFFLDRVWGEEENNPLSIYNDGNKSYLKATIEVDFAAFDQKDSWFGNSKGMLHGGVTNFWWESLVRPGIEGIYTLNQNSEKLYGRFDVVQANTGAGLDADGTNQGLGAVSYLSVDHAYAGWRSGNLFSAFGEDFLDISFGRQSYLAGTGMLFDSEGSSGYNKAAWFLGGRTSAEYAGIIRIKSGGWAGDLFYLEPDELKETNTKAGGTTLDYNFDNKIGNVGGGFYAIDSADPDHPTRDGMKVYDVRADVKPFEMYGGPSILKPLRFEGEYAYEDQPKNSYGEGEGWYVATTYQFDNIPWTPSLTYRYASFNENFDPLFYAATDWCSWFQGKIIGEYVLGNSNLDRLTSKTVNSLILLM